MSSNLNIQVRPATVRDAKTIAEIHVNTWHTAYAGLVPDDYLKGMSVDKLQAQWRESIQYSEPQVVVALDGNAIVGFAGFDRTRDPKTKPTTGEIWAMYVASDYWGEGAGLALWGWLPRRSDRRRMPGSHAVVHAAQRACAAFL